MPETGFMLSDARRAASDPKWTDYLRCDLFDHHLCDLDVLSGRKLCTTHIASDFD